MKQKETGIRYIILGLLAFTGLGTEGLYAFFVEPLIYGSQMSEWSTVQHIIHWIITCITWGIVSFLLYRFSKNKCDFNMFEKKESMKKWQWAGVLICVIFSLVMSYIDWNGFKVIKEFQYNGLIKFIFQYIYYAFETVLFMLIIVFIQKACEMWSKKKDIPYGGIACAITWGLAHIFTKGSISVGLLSAISGFTYGVVYLLQNRDIKKTYLILFVMFML